MPEVVPYSVQMQIATTLKREENLNALKKELLYPRTQMKIKQAPTFLHEAQAHSTPPPKPREPRKKNLEFSAMPPASLA